MAMNAVDYTPEEAQTKTLQMQVRSMIDKLKEGNGEKESCVVTNKIGLEYLHCRGKPFSA
jgi:hypothetical protein